MIKRRKYLKRCPVRDRISVEKADLHVLCRPSMDGMMILPKPLFSKAPLIENPTPDTPLPLFPYYKRDKGTKRSDLTEVIREDRYPEHVLLREPPKNKGLKRHFMDNIR